MPDHELIVFSGFTGTGGRRAEIGVEAFGQLVREPRVICDWELSEWHFSLPRGSLIR
jgi:hypothetical protein